MSNANEQKTLLYVSELAKDVPPIVVGAITKMARVNNHARGVTGLLIFDGLRFAQILEGPGPCVNDLRAKLQADARHVKMKVLADERQSGSTRFGSWGLGFLLLEEESQGIASLYGRASEDAVAAFLALSSLDELDGDVQVR